jgi:hypothetical protein
MTKSASLALLVLLFAGTSNQVEAGACCVSVPKTCLPVLRIPAADYVPDPGLLSPPEPVPYGIWYNNLYDVFCRGQAERDCIWACAPVHARHGVRASF